MNLHTSNARTDPARPVHIGDHLREWRQRRHLSQLDLAGDAEISARHLSFVETGRAAPSREMVLKLAERLDVHVALAQGHVEPFCELQDHLARRRGAAGLHEAQMARRYFGIAGKIELAQMAALPPLAQVIADMDGTGRVGSSGGCVQVHGGEPTMRCSRLPLPPT